MALTLISFATNFMLLLSLLVIASATDGGYVPKPDLHKPKLDEEKLLSTKIAIQGLVYCKSGSKLTPLEGAVTRITCEAVDEYGFETTPFTFLSDTSDAEGFFFATLCPSEVANNSKLKQECKVFLELSPSETCNVPTDINKGITGSDLLPNSYRFLNHKKMKLYTVGPFYFTT
ncbi:Pollen Ole e 1 allergen/extensin [Quillaja saponaria]|uniref:Pollen Ole e 1 allergen/extensin n=1 Tax=Quillaja saponaria TaxID=32244 RepID=A0AAD7Q9V0_QUISA|nr:Pollen Ole e 1 allergen/extensin [Quillaja saponaria]